MEKFKPGDMDVVEKLNAMVATFNAGPYGALPLTGGTLSGEVGSITSIYTGLPGSPFTSSALFSPYGGLDPVSGERKQVAGFAVRGIPNLAHSGQWQVTTSCGPGAYRDDHTLSFAASDQSIGVTTYPAFQIRGNGDTAVGGKFNSTGLVQSADRLVAPILQVGPFLSTAYSSISAPSQVQGNTNLSLQNCADFLVSSGAFGSSASTTVRLASSSITGRSLNAGGTLNAGGADYAEYLIKGRLCGTIVPGQIVGIDADGQLTDKWDLAISYAVKSTNPCLVGGDTWSAHLGECPAAPVLPEPVEPGPVEPVRVMPDYGQNGSPGDGDDAWAEKQALYLTAKEAYAAQVAEHGEQVAAYSAAKKTFDTDHAKFQADLEAARQMVDRIAFAGQVPVNLQGAAPGQFIVPVQDGDGIGGLAIDEADITLRQYMRAIGRVIAIEDDGRARIIVKVA